MDLYSILDITKTASLDDIKRAYRRKAKQYHPDTNNGVVSGLWEDIKKAYHILSNSEKRKAYDSSGYIPDSDENIERAIFGFLRDYLKSKMFCTESVFEIDLVQDIKNICENSIMVSKAQIEKLENIKQFLEKFKSRFHKKEELKIDYINVIFTEQLTHIKSDIMTHYNNIEMFKVLITMIDNYEFDIIKYLGETENV